MHTAHKARATNISDKLVMHTTVNQQIQSKTDGFSPAIRDSRNPLPANTSPSTTKPRSRTSPHPCRNPYASRRPEEPKPWTTPRHRTTTEATATVAASTRPLRRSQLRPGHGDRELPHLISISHRHAMQQLARPHRLHPRHRTEPVAKKLQSAFHIGFETTIVLADLLDGL